MPPPCQATRTEGERTYEADRTHEADITYEGDRTYETDRTHEADITYEGDRTYEGERTHEADITYEGDCTYEEERTHDADITYEGDVLIGKKDLKLTHARSATVVPVSYDPISVTPTNFDVADTEHDEALARKAQELHRSMKMAEIENKVDAEDNKIKVILRACC